MSIHFKPRYFLLLFAVNLMLLISCKDKSEAISQTRFKIEIEILMKKEEKLEIFYKEDEMRTYDEEHKIQLFVEGKDQFQKIEFYLPVGVFPSSIRLDLGENRSQNYTEITHIGLSYKEEGIDLSLKEIPFFFVPNEYVIYDRSSGRADLNELNSKYDPYLESTPLLMKKLELIESLAK